MASTGPPDRITGEEGTGVPQPGQLTYEPFDPAVLADPYQRYAELRDREPVLWQPELESWIVTRYDDVRRIIGDQDSFAADWTRAGAPPAGVGLVTLQTTDGDYHQHLRGPVRSAMRPPDDLGARFRAEALRRLRALRDVPEFDFVSAVARPLAEFFVVELLAFRQPAPGWLSDVSRRIAAGMDEGFDPAKAAIANAARREVNECLRGAVEQPDGSLLAGLHRAIAGAVEDSADATPEAAATGTLRVLLLAGYENLHRALSLVGRRFGECCAGHRRWRHEPRAIANELIRWDSPVQAVSRAAVRDFELSGTTVHRGQIVVGMVGSANRDERRFDRPDELDPARTRNDHLSFGRGPHACIGAALALTQMELLMSAIAELDAYPVPCGPVDWSRTATLRGPERLPVAWTPFS
jgi:cytochrome P450